MVEIENKVISRIINNYIKISREMVALGDELKEINNLLVKGREIEIEKNLKQINKQKGREYIKKLTPVEIRMYDRISMLIEPFNWLTILRLKHTSTNVSDRERRGISRILHNLKEKRMIKEVKRYTKKVNGDRRRFVDYQVLG